MNFHVMNESKKIVIINDDSDAALQNKITCRYCFVDTHLLFISSGPKNRDVARKNSGVFYFICSHIYLILITVMDDCYVTLGVCDP